MGIIENVYGRKHLETAAIYSNLADTYTGNGDYLKAQEWNHKALNIRVEILGEEHPATALSYNNIASAYLRQGDYIKSIELTYKALYIIEKTLGWEHPYSVTFFNNIVYIYNNHGNCPVVQEWYQKALCVSDTVLDERNFDNLDNAAEYIPYEQMTFSSPSERLKDLLHYVDENKNTPLDEVPRTTKEMHGEIAVALIVGVGATLSAIVKQNGRDFTHIEKENMRDSLKRKLFMEFEPYFIRPLSKPNNIC